MSSEQDTVIICCGSVWVTLFVCVVIAFPEYSPLFLVGSLFFIAIVAIVRYVATEEEKRKKLEAQMKSRGLVKYKGKWGAPEQVFEWQQLEKGLVKYGDTWVTPKEKKKIEEEIERKRKERELFEAEQRRKGLVKFIDRFGKEHWGASEEIEVLRKKELEERQKEFEERQKANGLVKYHGEWVTPERKFEKEQLAKGLHKYIDRKRNSRWGTPEQIEKWREKDFEEEQRAKGFVKHKGKWIPKGELELLNFEKKTSEVLAKEIATYIRKNSKGLSLGKRTFNELITRFWMEKYRAVLLERWNRTVASKMREAEGATLNVYLSFLTEELIEWAQNKNLMRLTKADVNLFLASNNLKLSTSLEQMLYRESKLKYRWLPTWKRK